MVKDIGKRKGPEKEKGLKTKGSVSRIYPVNEFLEWSERNQLILST